MMPDLHLASMDESSGKMVLVIVAVMSLEKRYNYYAM